MNLFLLFRLLILLLLLNLTTVILFKKKFGESLIITLFIPAFFLYFSQFIFKTFNYGMIFTYLYALLSIIILIIHYGDKKFYKDVRENYFTNGLYSFIIIFLLFTVYDLKRNFSHWDEWSHWGEMLKEMLRIDNFYSVSDSVLQAHKDYPPILQLYELFVLKVINVYKEPYVIFSLHLLEASMFIPFIVDKIDSKVKSVVVPIIITMSFLLLTLLFDQHGIINSIYNDYFMALIVAYVLSYIFIIDDYFSMFTVLNICLGSSILLLTKQIGLTLYMMILFMYILCVVLRHKKQLMKKELLIKILRSLFVIIAIPLCMWFSWHIFVKKLELVGQFELGDIKVGQLYNVSIGKGTYSYQTESYNNYISAIKTFNLTTSYIQLTYFQAIILLLTIIYYIRNIDKKLISENKRITLITTLVIGAFGYAFVMLCTYVICYREVE